MIEASTSLCDQVQSEPVLRVQQLVLKIPTYEGLASILHGVELTVHEKEIVGLVGETGSGKTMTAMAIAGLVKSPPAILEAKEISLKAKTCC